MPAIYYEEVQCKSLINRVHTDMGFKWTINPYRGCQHACVYCFARSSHEHLGFSSGLDFQSRIIVKVNAPEVLREELRRPGWRHEFILVGTACDPYQQCETRYQLSRAILEALCQHCNPIGMLTKSHLVLRDLDLLQEFARRAPIRINFSVGTLDEEVWKKTEPGTPHPRKRLEALGKLAAAGVPTGIMLAPILPGLSDHREGLEEVIKVAIAHGARSISPVVLHLRPGSKEWFMPFLREAYPHLMPQYAKLYRGPYAPEQYTQQVYQVVEELIDKWGLQRQGPVQEPPRGQLALAL
jgi:DNA repair photolyase